MNGGPLSLFLLCCDSVITLCEAEFYQNTIFETLGGFLVEQLLTRAIDNENKYFNENIIWKPKWKIFLNKNIRYASIPWKNDAIECLKSENIRVIVVVLCPEFDASLIHLLPSSADILLFQIDRLMMDEEGKRSWLPEAEQILKSLCDPYKSLDHPPTNGLTEVDLGSVTTTSSDLQRILLDSPNLKYLRHYQMVKALYDLHSESWKKGEKLPVYKLKNLDIDFSHVVRCRMSPEWVLAPDALQLTTALCPHAVSIRLRFDCSTPNDVLAPLLNLEKIHHFSAVCVTSGERTNLDFSDMTPILEKFGPSSLTFLELKVIEEVEVHVIIEYCFKVETVVLSGCGYVTPPTCPSYDCQAYKPGTLSKLKNLFFADGDDFSWDHGAPECFWRATLLPGRRDNVGIQGLFLEFPRIPDPLTAEIFKRSEKSLPFPDLKVLSLCRFMELTLADIVAICGLESSKQPPINFLRLSDCEQIPSSEERKLRAWFQQVGIECKIYVDESEGGTEQRRPYTYKIARPR